MERNRDARRGTVTAVNGGGLSRRRQRKGSYRDSPEEDGGMEMAETGRLRERASKKDRDRDRDRSGRNKRRRGERILHVSNREEGDDSSSESVDEEEEEDDDASVHVRLPLPPPPNPGAAPSMPHNHHRRSFPMTAKVARPPAVWKAADEMIGVPVPRRARSSSAKRPQDFSLSGGGGEPIHPQGSTSPARPSPSSTAPISPTSSGASVRKKMKPISGAKHRPPKISKSSSVSEDLEIEVAEVLFGLTRQFQSPSKQETNKLDSKDTNGSVNDVKLRVSSPVSISPQPPASQPSQLSALPPSSLSSNSASMQASAPKRKRPRPVVKMEDESSTTPASVPALPGTSVSSASKMELEPPPKTEVSSPPRSEKIEVSTAVGNGSVKSDVGVPQFASAPVNAHQDLAKPESNSTPDFKLSTRESVGQDRTEAKEEVSAPTKENLRTDLDVNLDGTTETKAVPAAESSREVKYSIDLMAPPGKSSPERECLPEYVAEAADNAPVTDTDMLPKVGNLKGEEKVEKTAKQEAAEIALEALKAENSMPEDLASKKQIIKERTLDLQLDFDKQDKDGKQHAQKQQPKSAKIEPKQEKSAQSVSLPLPMPVPGWPGGFPSFGYMGQVPSLQPVVPMDGISGSSKNIQPPTFLSPQPRPKRCATHGYIAHNIHYQQQLSRMNPFWPAATAAPPMYGGKQYNLNMVPSSESSILGNSLQGSVPARKWSSVQDKGGSSTAAYPGRSSKDKNSAGSTFMEPSQRKQLVLQQAPQPGTATNMLHGPAFIFPINQQQAAAAAAAAARSGASISTPGAGNAAASSNSASSAVAASGTGVPAATMSFNYPGLPPNEAHQYMAILQNGTYQFPIPAHVGPPPPYRGGSPAQAVPFFNGPFYSSPMLHPQHQPPHQQHQPPQQQHQPPHQQPSHSHAQQGHQNPSTSSGSSSSQKPPQQSQRAPGGGAAGTVGSSHSLAASKHQRSHLPTQSEIGGDDNPSTPDSRVSQTQKNIYGNNLAMAIHPQNFALISSAAAAALGSGGGGGHNEKQQPPPQHTATKVDLTTSQAFAMSFAPFGGAAATPLPSLDFSSMVQNHALFQGIPEATRLGYQFSAATAGATHATPHKKPPHQVLEDGKSAGDSMNASMTGEEERKIMTTSKAPASISQHSLNFSRPDSDPPTSTILGNSVVDVSSRTLNLIQAPSNVGRVSNRPGNAGPTTSGSATAAAASNSQLLHQQQQQQLQQQHQHMVQLQKQQQQLQLQHHIMNRTKSSTPATSATVYSDRLPAGSTMAKFPQALAGFPQALIQSSGATQSPQWKASTRAATPSPVAATSTSTSKSQLPQQQGRSMQQPHLTPSHQTQISFGVNSSKAAAHTGQHHLAGGNSNPSLSSAASIVVGSPQSAVSKNAGGSPRSSSSAKAGPSQATVLPHQQQQPGKNSPSSSSLKSSPLSNSSAPSILGHPHMSPASNASAKQQHHSQPQPQPQPQQQLHKQQPFPQAQFFFSNAYMTAQTSQSNGATAAAYYHQRRQSEQPQQQGQQNPTPGSSGILSLCPSAMTLSGAPTTSDPAKAAAAAATNMKGIAAHGLLQHPAQFATVSQPAPSAPHPLMSAAAAFPYMHTMPSVSVKPAEQKPAAGNDNLHACWQPEKR